MSWLTRMLRNLAGSGTRKTDLGLSPNHASSFHLAWEMPATIGTDARLVEVSAVLEIQVSPAVQSLYFWALQVDFADGRGAWGTAHTGLQWNPRYPGNTAVNWGGYYSTARGSAVLPGTLSALHGFSDDPNTLSYPWAPGRPYRLRVFASPEIAGAWRAEVTDLASGESSNIRDLLPAPDGPTSGRYLTRPIVWSEVFADCDAPSVTVKWSGLTAVDYSGRVVEPWAVRVNYQPAEAGGCLNTTVVPDGMDGFRQITNAQRLVVQGTSLPLAEPIRRS